MLVLNLIFIEYSFLQLTLKRIEAGGAIDPETTFSLVSNTGVSHYNFICRVL